MMDKATTQQIDHFCPEQLSRRWRAFQEEVQPFIKIKARIYALTLPEIQIHEDKVVTKYNFTPKQKKVLDKLDEIIFSIERKHSTTPPPNR